MIPCKKKNPGLLLHNGRYWYRYKNEIGSFYIHDERVYYVWDPWKIDQETYKDYKFDEKIVLLKDRKEKVVEIEVQHFKWKL